MWRAESLLQPLLQLLGLVGKLSRVRTSEFPEVLEFPLDRGHFREVRAGGRGPVRGRFDQTHEESPVLGRQCGGKFRAEPLAHGQ